MACTIFMLRTCCCCSTPPPASPRACPRPLSSSQRATVSRHLLPIPAVILWAAPYRCRCRCRCNATPAKFRLNSLRFIWFYLTKCCLQPAACSASGDLAASAEQCLKLSKQSDRTNNKCPGRMIKGMSGWANWSSGYLRFELLHSSLPWQATNRVVRRTALHNGGGQLPRLLECVGGELVKTEYRLPSRLAIFLNFHMKTKTSPARPRRKGCKIASASGST